MVKSDKDQGRDSHEKRKEQATQGEVRALHSPPGVLARLGLGKTSFPAEASQDQLKTGLADPVWSVRVAALQALASRGEPVPLELLVPALEDENGWVRAAAVRAVGAFKEQASVDRLVIALHDGKWSVRAAAALALGALGEWAPVEPLLMALRDDEDESVRVAAVAALGMLKEWVPVEAVVGALGDCQWRVREMAVLVLGEMGERVPVEPLVSVLRDDIDRPVCEAARRVLKQTHPGVFSTLPPDSKSLGGGDTDRGEKA